VKDFLDNLELVNKEVKKDNRFHAALDIGEALAGAIKQAQAAWRTPGRISPPLESNWQYEDDKEGGIVMSSLSDLSQEDLLTACLWAEARGEPEDGQKGVCNVILNGVRKHMAQSIPAVILQPNQFSWTNPNDVNFQKVFTVETKDPNGWERAQRIAQAALARTLEDNTNNADHYLNVGWRKDLAAEPCPNGLKKASATVR
jgi:spore germination cell wall hydrolase CwlJ-like protein